MEPQKVSLRKASYLAKQLASADELKVSTSVDAVIFSDYEKELEVVSQQLRDAVAAQERIERALKTLRLEIKIANQAIVDGLLSELSSEQRMLKIYSSLHRNLDEVPRAEVIAAKVAKAEKADEDSWRRETSVEVSSQDSHDFLAQKVSQSKKRILRLEEALSEENLSRKVTLNSEVVSVLDELDLI